MGKPRTEEWFLKILSDLVQNLHYRKTIANNFISTNILLFVIYAKLCCKQILWLNCYIKNYIFFILNTAFLSDKLTIKISKQHIH